ncbi:MAG: TMEM175 family protein [Solirubrobacteraceae bacterium]
MNKTRLEAFSDGIFAIAATLLVLDLHVQAKSGGLAKALWHEWPHYATFVVSFLTIGIIWVNHHGQFQRIAMVDRPLLFLNLLLLMFVVLIPFPTDLLASYLHSGSDQHIAAAVYSGTLLLMGFCFAASWRYASAHSELLTRAISQRELKALIARNAVGQAVYVVALGLAFVSAPVCLALCALAAIYYTLPGRLPEGDTEIA